MENQKNHDDVIGKDQFVQQKVKDATSTSASSETERKNWVQAKDELVSLDTLKNVDLKVFQSEIHQLVVHADFSKQVSGPR